ncbi:DNA mismatch repair endonuclease MutL [Clostridiaceae bacterium 35-E11]
MMKSRIKKLDKFIANKIAAGEVVDRPASVVKELLENAIDAHASEIIIEIKEGGKSYLRVTDNGSGIHESDVKIAFERHATSKIRDVEDLNTIISLGFRGEALASIASVSQVELITKTEDVLAGSYLELHGGKIIEHREIGCPQGTTLVIKNLFYNTPARFQFMKSNAAETSYISNIIGKYALAYPHISFRFINNGTIVFTTSGSGSVINNIAGIYGKEIAQNMYLVKNKNELLTLEGYISKPSISRGNRQLQACFVNGRYIKSEVINNAIDEAYKTLVMVNKFPICIIYLTISPNKLDVNIHPTKTEIRFHDPAYIKRFIIESLRKKLLDENLIPDVNFNVPKATTNFQECIQERMIDLNLSSTTTKKLTENIGEKQVIEQHIVKEDKLPFIANNTIKSNIPKKVVHKEEMKEKDQVSSQIVKIYKNIYDESKKTQLPKNIRIIGQIFNSYLIGQDGDIMYLIDQHAAHERIMYEQLLRQYKQQSIISQKRLTPILIELSYAEFETVKNNIDIFKNLGFEIEEFGMNTYMLRAVPLVFGEPEARQFFLEVLDNLQKQIHNSYDMKMDKIIHMACKQAIKAKDKLDTIEITELMKQLSSLDNPFTCPHGRPVIVSISKYELEKKFKRT